MTPEEIMAKAIEANSVEIYKDTVSPAAKQVGKMAEDSAKVLRLITAPLQLMAAWQDRFERYCKRIAEFVPPENLQEPPLSFAGPIVERLKYLEEENYLSSLYLNLLSRAMDKTRVNEAHPAFLHIIDQLSPDEALMFSQFNDPSSPNAINFKREWQESPEGKILLPYKIIEGKMPAFTFPENLMMYLTHLSSLNLIQYRHDSYIVSSGEAPIEINSGKYQEDLFIIPTEFGILFLKAVIPEP